MQFNHRAQRGRSVQHLLLGLMCVAVILVLTRQTPHQSIRVAPHEDSVRKWEPAEDSRSTSSEQSQQPQQPQKIAVPPKEIDYSARFNAACKAKQVKYYKEHTTQFKKDYGKEHFLQSMRQTIPDMCASRWTQGVEGAEVAVIDIGANTGQDVETWNKGFAMAKGQDCPHTTVYLFEPVKRHHPSLRTKMAEYPTHHNELVTQAVSNKTGAFRMYHTNSNEQSTLDKPLKWFEKQDNSSYMVDVTTLDNYFDSHRGLVDVPILKIDTEGKEANVFKGGKRLLKKVRSILFECSDTMKDSRGTGDTLKDVVDFLSGAGFDTFKLGKATLLLLSGDLWDNAYWDNIYWSNCAALPRGSTLHRMAMAGELGFSRTEKLSLLC